MTRPLPRSRVLALAAMDPSEPVRVRTWQSLEGWTAALERGYLTGSHGFRDDDDDMFDRPYAWMRDRMAERIHGFSGDLPVWAWLKGQNPRRSPWLRDRVRITAVVPRGRMLLSDHELWHIPLNRGSIHLTRADDDAWPHEHGSPEAESTWNHVLDLERGPSPDPRWLGAPRIIQACVDRIHLDEIVCTRITARS